MSKSLTPSDAMYIDEQSKRIKALVLDNQRLYTINTELQSMIGCLEHDKRALQVELDKTKDALNNIQSKCVNDSNHYSTVKEIFEENKIKYAFTKNEFNKIKQKLKDTENELNETKDKLENNEIHKNLQYKIDCLEHDKRALQVELDKTKDAFSSNPNPYNLIGDGLAFLRFEFAKISKCYMKEYDYDKMQTTLNNISSQYYYEFAYNDRINKKLIETKRHHNDHRRLLVIARGERDNIQQSLKLTQYERDNLRDALDTAVFERDSIKAKLTKTNNKTKSKLNKVNKKNRIYKNVIKSLARSAKNTR